MSIMGVTNTFVILYFHCSCFIHFEVWSHFQPVAHCVMTSVMWLIQWYRDLYCNLLLMLYSLIFLWFSVSKLCSHDITVIVSILASIGNAITEFMFVNFCYRTSVFTYLLTYRKGTEVQGLLSCMLPHRYVID